MSGRSDTQSHRQFSLFETRPLFEAETLDRARQEWGRSTIPEFDPRSAAARRFIKEIQDHRRKGLKEEALEQQFNQAIFADLLSYQVYPGTEGQWSAWPKPPVAVTGLTGIPDLLLGAFDHERFEPVVVVELKKPATNLDAPQGSYGGLTPVEQAFGYARRLGTCRWVCVSNMHLLRLYAIESASSYYEMDLWSMDPDWGSLKDAWHLLAAENLISPPDDSGTWRLLTASQNTQVAFQEGFYSIYSEIRDDLITAVGQALPSLDRHEQVQATQRLLDRLLFVYFCEDHPDRLLRRNVLKDVVENAVRQPGPSRTKAYDALKSLFRDLDVGVDTEFWKVPRYNGELFKPHAVLDNITLPDSLHGKRYTWMSRDSVLRRSVDGAYGLHIFDFWKELDRDLLGNIFERSIGDLTAISAGGRPDARQAFGIYYTAARLARFAASSVVAAALEDDEALQDLLQDCPSPGEDTRQADAVLAGLQRYRIADIACGSGVFLTAAFDSLLEPFRKALEASAGGAITRELISFRQSELLKTSIFGCDLLPQAVELAKLSLWLAAARRNEPSADLSSNFLTGDSLAPTGAAALAAAAGGQFDIIVGNPPWGAEYDVDQAEEATGLDSWEIFLRLCAELLRPGGRLSLILPDTIFSPAKRTTRKWLVENFEVEKLYSLGPDWFTNQVRMGTVLLQAKKHPPAANHLMKTLLLAGTERLAAQRGLRPLQQAEAIGGSYLSQDRAKHSADGALTVLLGEEERPLIDKIDANSVALSSITTRARGDEMSASGIFWQCGNCQILTVPGAKKKGGGYKPKACPNCGAALSLQACTQERIVGDLRVGPFNHPFVDGDALTSRYQNPKRKYIRTDLRVQPALKQAAIFDGPRIAIRQAGVGLTATILNDSSRVPQSVYLYWLTDEARSDGYTEEFVLACLVSRVMNYIHMKTSGEVDPARAFAKVTHERLASFPIPRLNTETKKRVARDVTDLARSMLAMPVYGGETDWKIESKLQSLWAITGDEGRFINGFFSIVPEGQARRDLFPMNPPVRVPFPSSRLSAAVPQAGFVGQAAGQDGF